MDGMPDRAADLARRAVEQGVEPAQVLDQACVTAMDYVGQRFGCHEMFLPDVMAASEAMKAAVGVLEPEMRRRGSERKTRGTVVLVLSGVVVGALAEIPEGELRAYDVPSGRVVVTHDERRLFAVSETCTGNGCALADGSFDDRSDRLLCAACESVFDAETGEPLEGPARDPLAVFTAREVDGWVEISAEPAG